MSKNEALEARRAYYREWKMNNPDKVKAYNQKFWAKYAEKAKQKEAVTDGKNN